MADDAGTIAKEITLAIIEKHGITVRRGTPESQYSGELGKEAGEIFKGVLNQVVGAIKELEEKRELPSPRDVTR